MTTRPRIHVTFVIGSLHLGGSQKHLYDLVRSLDRERFRCSAVVFEGGGDYYERFVAEGVSIHNLDIRSRADLLRRFPAFVRLLKELRPDVLHLLLYMSSLYGCLASLLLAKRPGVIMSKRSMENDMPWTRRVAYRGVITKVPDVITAVSEPVRGRCIELGAAPHRVRTIENGIEGISPGAPGLLKSHLGLPDDVTLVATLGSLTERKQQVLAIEMLPLLLRVAPSVHLALIGEGPLRETLRQRAATLGIAGRVHLPGRLVPGTDYLADVSAFLLPSAEEGTSNALLEALVLGVPCIASDIPSNAAVLEQGVDGVLVDPRNPELFAAAVAGVLNDPGHAAQLIAAGKAKIARSYSLDAMVHANEALYEELCAGAVTHPSVPSPAPLGSVDR